MNLSLRNGDSLPSVGLGCWKIPKPEAAEVIATALELGYRHIDAACDYGNEVEVGQGIARALAAGHLAREELHVTSKLWNSYHEDDPLRFVNARTSMWDDNKIEGKVDLLDSERLVPASRGQEEGDNEPLEEVDLISF